MLDGRGGEGLVAVALVLKRNQTDPWTDLFSPLTYRGEKKERQEMELTHEVTSPSVRSAMTSSLLDSSVASVQTPRTRTALFRLTGWTLGPCLDSDESTDE